jgi:preprotein translocase subunit SecF
MVWFKKQGKIMEKNRTNKIFDFMGKKNIFISISVITIILSLSILLTKGLNLGIDFAGGTIIQIQYENKAPINKIRAILDNSEFKDATIVEFGLKNEIVINVKTQTSDVAHDIADTISSLLANSGNFKIRKTDMVGSKVGDRFKSSGIMAILLSLIAILAYVSFRFEYRFAISSIFALIHDVTIAIGAIILFDISVNLDILAAILIILGYSLNDTIIVFDRVRQRAQESKITEINSVINEAVTMTLSRTILTSLTTLFVVISLYIFGGEATKGFSLTLIVGIIVGTYSSIFIASSFLVWLKFDIVNYQKKEAQKLQKKIEKDKIRAMYEQGTI